MLRNNLIVAWRNLRRYRMYTAINVGGLGRGLRGDHLRRPVYT